MIRPVPGAESGDDRLLRAGRRDDDAERRDEDANKRDATAAARDIEARRASEHARDQEQAVRDRLWDRQHPEIGTERPVLAEGEAGDLGDMRQALTGLDEGRRASRLSRGGAEQDRRAAAADRAAAAKDREEARADREQAAIEAAQENRHGRA